MLSHGFPYTHKQLYMSHFKYMLKFLASTGLQSLFEFLLSPLKCSLKISCAPRNLGYLLSPYVWALLFPTAALKKKPVKLLCCLLPCLPHLPLVVGGTWLCLWSICLPTRLLHFPPLCCNSTSSLSQKTTFISDKELDPSGGNIMYAIEQQSSGDLLKYNSNSFKKLCSS